MCHMYTGLDDTCMNSQHVRRAIHDPTDVRLMVDSPKAVLEAVGRYSKYHCTVLALGFPCLVYHTCSD